MRKLLVICGPTATGKTSLALHLAKVLASGQAGELVSADSRQVYKRMDIGTGKDLPENSKTQKLKNSKLPEYYLIKGIKMWGYDLVEPTEEFSVAQYVKVAGKIIEDIWRRKKLPILVGGTGLYIKAVVDGIPTAEIPRDESLRKSLEGKSVVELFEILAQIDAVKAASLNVSDRKNPRRLVRAIEVALDRSRVKGQGSIIKEGTDTLFIGLTLNKEKLEERIKKRIKKRLAQGLLEEIKELLNSGVDWDNQSMQALGYKEWKPLFLGKVGRQEVVEEWTTDEKKYAKRQHTWFKRDKRINWFVSSLNLKKE